MAKALEFNTVLNSIPVNLTGEDGQAKNFTLKELNGDQRAAYDKCFDVKLEVTEGTKVKAIPGDKFKIMPAKEFLAFCLYDSKDKPVSEEIIGTYPSRILEKLHEEALKLSGMDADTVKAKAEAKNG